ncbi:hypothetical protein RQM47_09100 [Rubrivirga sp. S365]|uniref:Uncharacterized protein n=1 Tax=Rubrivirga litoralis TaxID=3075598 RepID=A0ABU3BSB4_9BACT|nr:MULTISPECIES: hypothetical protein [unclassified Rubrivirga]MDT0632185.1 hypothetical protein [Rubrivirga sp. F394]MDT7856795.1 hypothetical protein [Rubrivirga sp. S365]
MRPLRPSLVVLAVAALVAGGCTRAAPDGLPPGTEIEDLPESESWDASLRSSADGRSRLEIDAPYLARYRRPDTTFVYLGPAPEGTGGAGAAGRGGAVDIAVYDDEGAPLADIRAREAWYYEGDGRLVTEGGVRTTVRGDGGADIQARRLTLVDDTVEAEGDVRATVQGGGGPDTGGADVEAARLTTRPGGAFTASGGTTVRLGGQAQATVQARTVSGSGGGRYEATGSVRVAASGGRTLQAGRVIWDEGAGRFRAPGAFSFDGPGERVRGVGLVASADLTRYSFRNVTGEIEVAE